MCYNLVYMTKKKIDYARWHGATEEELSQLEQELRDLERKLDNRPPMFHANGFGHPDIPIITDKEPDRIQFFEWGFIPDEFWVDNLNLAIKRQKNNLNARGETIFKKPSWRKAAKYNRCLVLIDGFYDYHYYNGKTYPFYIRLKNEKPFAVAGLWAIKEFKNEGAIKKTATIITCDPNPMMAKIHNNPASSDEPRMPVILPKELEKEWLRPYKDDFDKQVLMDLIRPYPQEEIVAYTVHRLTGKESVPNTEEKLEEYIYEDLKYPI